MPASTPTLEVLAARAGASRSTVSRAFKSPEMVTDMVVAAVIPAVAGYPSATDTLSPLSSPRRSSPR